MLRYLKLYAYFVRFSVMRSLEFRLDFCFRIVMDLCYYGVQFSLYGVLFRSTTILGEWNQEQALIFVAAYCVVDALQMTFLSNNLWWLPVLVNKGDLDYYLVRPISSLFFISLRDFAVNSFINLLFALGILVWVLVGYSEPISFYKILLFGFFLLNGTLLNFIVHMFFVIPVFWTQSSRGFEQVFWTFSRFMERPDKIFTGWMRRILISIIPFSLMASFPSHILFEDFNIYRILYMSLVTALLFAVLLLFWDRALKSYSSASS